MASPDKKILILNDRITGHLRQCEAVSAEIESIWAERGVPHSQIASRTLEIDVKYRRSNLEKLLFFFRHPRWKWCAGCAACAEHALADKDLAELARVEADVVISAFGKRCADAGLWLKEKKGARSIVLMTPRTRRGEFDLVITPRHDNVTGPNFLLTEGAPNAVNPESAREKAQQLVPGVFGTAGRRVGLLLGGDYKHFRMRPETIAALAAQIDGVAAEAGAEIYATSSRRTPTHADAELKKIWGNDPKCRLLVIASEENPQGTVPAILGLAEAVVVSPESVTMISEAASSGAHVIVYDDAAFVHEKHRRFLDNLHAKGHIRLCEVGNVGGELREYFKTGRRTQRLDDRSAIRTALEKIV